MFPALALALALPGCKKVPEAPKEYDELVGYLFEHQWDEDQAGLVAGLDRMAAWLDDEWDPEEQSDGFTVHRVSGDAMDDLDGENRTNRGQVGVSLPTESTHSVSKSTWALVTVDQDEVFPDDFSDYEREYLSGPDCFIERTCGRMEAEEWMTTNLGFGWESEGHSFNQYVWAEMSEGDAMVHRNWQVEPPELPDAFPAVDEQVYLNLFIPRGSGRAWRVQAQWTVYDPDENVPEEWAKSLIVGFFAESSETLDAWLDENG